MLELGYNGDAATKRISIYHYRTGKLVDGNASNYDPPDNGVHLCGVTDDEEQPTTLAAYPMAPHDARAFFAVAQEVAACDRDAGDFVADLCIGGDIDTDFWSNRQLWPRAIEAWNACAALNKEGGE